MVFQKRVVYIGGGVQCFVPVFGYKEVTCYWFMVLSFVFKQLWLPYTGGFEVSYLSWYVLEPCPATSSNGISSYPHRFSSLILEIRPSSSLTFGVSV